MSRHKLIGSFCLSMLLLPACWGIAGNGHRSHETRDHKDFTGVESSGPFEVSIVPGDEFSIVVNIDSNLQRHLDTHVSDASLVIDADAHVYDFLPGPHVSVTMPHLVYARLAGSGSLDARTFEEQSTLRLEVAGSGELAFAGSAPRIEASLEGSGDMQLSGSCEFADLKVEGSGDLHARQLIASGGRVELDGSGDLTATIDGPVDAELDGSGDIHLYGDVDLRHSQDHGSGDIVLH